MTLLAGSFGERTWRLGTGGPPLFLFYILLFSWLAFVVFKDHQLYSYLFKGAVEIPDNCTIAYK